MRIEPQRDSVVTTAGVLPITHIHLGGIPRGAAVVVAESGRSGFDSVDVMNSLAEHGYETVLALLSQDLTPAPRGSGQGGGDALGAVVFELARHLGRRGWTPEQTGLIGYGLGGRAVLGAAATGQYGAAVSVSPVAHSPQELGVPVQTPWLGLFADRGDARPAMVLAAEAQKTQSPVYVETVEYRGVEQDFYRTSVTPVAHAAAFDAWQRTIEWLNLRVAPRTTPLAGSVFPSAKSEEKSR